MNNTSLQMVINQLFEIQNKINEQGQTGFERNFTKLFSILEEEGYIIQDPVSELYTDSRTDCEASIVGSLSSKMKITKTIKPVIYKKTDGNIQLIQKAVVLVEKF